MVDPVQENNYESLVEEIYQMSHYDFVGIALQNSDALGQIKWRYVRGNTSQRYQRIVLRNGLGIAGLVLRTGQPFYDNDLNRKPQDFMYTPITVVEKLTSAAAIPLLSADNQQVTGVLLAGYRHGENVSHETISNLRYYLRRA
ncbi:MAG: GAF domain-containing protein [Lactobacillus sp.]|jgi:nitrogen regulatory protein A|nr:GAF domain-containing protein [Lactobacillus sp.]